MVWYYVQTTGAGYKNIFNLRGSAELWVEQTGGGNFGLGGAATATSGTATSAGNWFRVAVVVSGTNISLYTALASTATLNVVSDTGFTINSPTRLGIGHAGSSGGQEVTDGRMANFKQYSAALTQAELELEFAQYQPQRTANLVRWVPWVNPEVTDYSGAGLNVIATGTPTIIDGPPIRWGRPRQSRRMGIPTVPLIGDETFGLTEGVPGLAAASDLSESFSLTQPTPSIAVVGSASESFSLTETASVFITNAVSDLGTVTVTESPSSLQIVGTASDTPTLTELPDIDVTTSAADTAAVTETSADTLQLTTNFASDSMSLSAEASQIDVTEVRVDSETFNLSENAVAVQFAHYLPEETYSLQETASVVVVAGASEQYSLAETALGAYQLTSTETSSLSEILALSVTSSRADLLSLTELAEPFVGHSRVDSLAVAEFRDLFAFIERDDFSTLGSHVDQIINALSASDVFTLLEEMDNGQVDLPNLIYGGVITANSLNAEVYTDNTIFTELVGSNSIRTEVWQPQFGGDVYYKEYTGEATVPVSKGGNVYTRQIAGDAGGVEP
jgi:hypothetical protein